MDIYIIKNVHTGETYKTPRGRASWNKPGAAKSAFMYQESVDSWRGQGLYPGLTKFDNQSDWAIEKVTHSSPIDETLHAKTKDTLDRLIHLVKRDGLYVRDVEYREIIDAFEGSEPP